MKNPNHGPTSFHATPTIPPPPATTCCKVETPLPLDTFLPQQPLVLQDHLELPDPHRVEFLLPVTDLTPALTTVLNGQETTTTTTVELNHHTTTTSPETTHVTALPFTHQLKTGDTPSQLVISTIPTLTASKHQNSQLVKEPPTLSVTLEDHFSLATTKLSTTLSPNQRSATKLTLALFATTPSPLGIKMMFHTGTSPTEISMMVVLTTTTITGTATLKEKNVTALTNLATTNKIPTLAQLLKSSNPSMMAVDPTIPDLAGTQLVTLTPMLEDGKPTNAPSQLPQKLPPLTTTVKWEDKFMLTGPHGDLLLSEMLATKSKWPKEDSETGELSANTAQEPASLETACTPMVATSESELKLTVDQCHLGHLLPTPRLNLTTLLKPQW